MNVERLKGKQYTSQVNVWVEPKLKQRIEVLKREKRINTAAEIRKALEELVLKLERVA